jgi:tetratricopeptide (TPR) repeat protein
VDRFVLSAATWTVLSLSVTACATQQTGVRPQGQPAGINAGPNDSLAQRRLRLGRFAEARALFQRDLDVNGASPYALTGLGDSYALAGDYPSARDAYQRLVQTGTSPQERVQGYLRVAESFAYARDYAGAERALEPALAVARSTANPALEWDVVARLNAIQRFANQLDQADQTAAEMSRIASSTALPEATRRTYALEALQVTPMIMAKRGNEPMAMRRVDAYFRACEAAGLPPHRDMMLGLIAAYLGHYAEAAERLDRAPERERNVYLYYWIGVAHESIGESAQARAAYLRIADWRLTDSVSRTMLPLVREPAGIQLRALR